MMIQKKKGSVEQFFRTIIYQEFITLNTTSRTLIVCNPARNQYDNKPMTLVHYIFYTLLHDNTSISIEYISYMFYTSNLHMHETTEKTTREIISQY
jgi:hypothetical protein